MTIRLPTWRTKLWYRIRALWYKWFYGVEFGFHGTMPAKFGPGKFVSVQKNGPYLEITAHKRMNKIPEGKIRIIPYQPNHGFMVEYHNLDGEIRWRTCCDYDMLYKMGASRQENPE